MKMPTDGEIRSQLVRWERTVPPRQRRAWYRFRNQIACSALFRAYMRRARVRGRGLNTRPIMEAALRRYDILNPHLYGERTRIAS
jgi:hypothetical protein